MVNMTKTLSLPNRGTLPMLVIGDLTQWAARGRLRMAPDQCEFVDITQLDQVTIRRYDQGLIVAPLLSGAFDAFDIAEKLAAAQFAGMFRVVADAVPNADLIRTEIEAAAPGLDFDLIVLPAARR